MAEVLPKRILKQMRGPIDVARGPSFVVLFSKDPSVVLLEFDYKNSSVSDKNDIDLSSAALIRNDDVSKSEELEAPWRLELKDAALRIRPGASDEKRDEYDADYCKDDEQNRVCVHLTSRL